MTQAIEVTEAQFLRPPSACGDEFERVTWSGTVAVHLRDDVHLGLRFNNADLQELVTTTLGDRVVPDLVDVPPYYSVRVGTPGRRKAAPMHHLYLGGRPVLGTRDLLRLVGGVGRHISAHLPTTRTGYVVDAIPVLTPRGVLLVPQEILSMSGPTDRVLMPAGFRFADVPRCEIDLVDASVIVPEQLVGCQVSRDDVAVIAPSPPESWLQPGRYPLAGWLLAVHADLVGPLRPAAAVLYTARLLDPPFSSGAQAALDGLRSLATRVPMTGITWTTHEEMIAAVLAAGQA
jgi:hypothetical protein